MAFLSKVSTAYTVVADYLSGELGFAAPSNGKIRAVTHAALNRLEKTGDLFSKKWWKENPLGYVQKEKLLSAIKSVIVSADSPWQPTITPNSALQQLFFNAFRGHLPKMNELLNQRALLEAIVWKKNPEMLDEMRGFMRQILQNISEEMTSLSPEQNFHMEVIIGELLCIYPHLGPKEGEEIQIPMLIEGKWELIAYTLKEIPLTPDWMGSPLIAYGFTPKQQASAPPILIFKGTTYPTDEGMFLGILTDLNPGASVGSYAFEMGVEALQRWLYEETKASKAIVYGKSLGGAQSWRTALHFPDCVQKVMSYGAPGFSSHDVERLSQIMKSSSSYPQINMFWQKNDPVTWCDTAPIKGLNYFRIVGSQVRSGPVAHLDMCSTHEHSAVIKLEPAKEAKRWQRFAITLLRDFLSSVIFPILVIAHIAYLCIKNAVRHFKKSRKQLTAPLESAILEEVI